MSTGTSYNQNFIEVSLSDLMTVTFPKKYRHLNYFTMDFGEVKPAFIHSRIKVFLMSHLYISPIQNVALLMTHLEIQGCPDDSFAP